jgi:hypothetical protein
MYRNRNLTIAAITMAALLGTGIFTTTSVYAGDGENRRNGGDSSETNTEQKLRQENFGDGTNTNCGQNLIDSSGIVCVPTPGTGDGGDGIIAECEACFDSLTPTQLSALLLIIGSLDVCASLDAEVIASIQTALATVQVDATVIAQIIACLNALVAV